VLVKINASRELLDKALEASNRMIEAQDRFNSATDEQKRLGYEGRKLYTDREDTRLVYAEACMQLVDYIIAANEDK
jgi:hypothetical protein